MINIVTANGSFGDDDDKKLMINVQKTTDGISEDIPMPINNTQRPLSSQVSRRV